MMTQPTSIDPTDPYQLPRMNPPTPTSPALSASSSMNAHSTLSFLDTLATEIITLRIGTGLSLFTVNVHRNILGDKSPILSSLLDAPTSTLPKVIDLPDEDPKLFGYLLEWIYKGSIGTPSEQTPAIKVEETLENEFPIPAIPAAALSPLTSGQKTSLQHKIKDLGKAPQWKRFSTVFTKLYPDKAAQWTEAVKRDMNLETIEQKLSPKNKDKVNGYKTLSEIDADFDLLYENHSTCHGSLHTITKAAADLRTEYHQKTVDMRKPTSKASPPPGPIATQQQQRQTEMQLLRIPLPTPELLTLYLLASKYSIYDLADLTLTSLIATHHNTNAFPSLPDIQLTFSSTKPPSKLRLYMARTVIWFLIREVEREDSPDAVLSKTENLLRLVGENEELGMLVFGIMRGRNGIAFGDPRLAKVCDYHEHGEERRCVVRASASANARKRKLVPL